MGSAGDDRQDRAAGPALPSGDALAGLVLITAALLALIAANVAVLQPYYTALFHHPLRWTPIAPLGTLELWINDGLMAVFFFVVGLEIRREVTDGDLAAPARRRLPVLAALAGMAVPAILFLAIAGGTPALRRGWAIPGATDIAFAVGVVALLGDRVPPALRLFLLAVAIVDDLGAVAIIALFYTSAISLAWLGAAAAVWSAMLALARSRRGRPPHAWPFALLAVILWFCTLHSGVHATIAGVLAAFAIPHARGGGADDLAGGIEQRLKPWTNYLIVPLFGFANAGVVLGGGIAALAAPLPLAIAAGLFVGKQVGVLGAIALATRLGIAARPAGAGWIQVWGMAILCGTGFTMSLFIGGLAFGAVPATFAAAKLGVIAGSLLSILLGFAVLWFAGGRARAA